MKIKFFAWVLAVILCANPIFASATEQSNSLVVGDLMSADKYTYGYEDDGVTIEIDQNEFKVYSNLASLQKSWSWFSSTTNEKKDELFKNATKGEVEFSHDLSKLNKSLEYSFKICFKYDGVDMYYYYIYDADIIIEYVDGSWQFKPTNEIILQNNYNLFYATNDVLVKTVTDESIIALSNEICQGLTDDYEKLYAINKWVVENIYYDYDYYYGNKSTTTLTTKDILESKMSVCEGYATVMQDLISAQGIICMKVSGLALGISQNSEWDDENASVTTTNHAWNEAYLASEDRWVIMDSTWDSSNKYINGEYTSGYDACKYFDISIIPFSQDHKIIRTEKGDFYNAKNDILVSEWAINDIKEAIERDFLSQDLIYGFSNSISREEFSKLAMGLIEATSQQEISQIIASFGDSSRAGQLTDTTNIYVEWLYQLNVVNGVGEGIFLPKNTITRQEAAVMLANILNMYGYSDDLDQQESYTDQESIDLWAIESVRLVSNFEIMQGSNGEFNPHETYTLEQAITTMNRLYEVLTK